MVFLHRWSLITLSFMQNMSDWEIKSVVAINRELLNKGGLNTGLNVFEQSLRYGQYCQINYLCKGITKMQKDSRSPGEPHNCYTYIRRHCRVRRTSAPGIKVSGFTLHCVCLARTLAYSRVLKENLILWTGHF